MRKIVTVLIVTVTGLVVTVFLLLLVAIFLLIVATLGSGVIKFIDYLAVNFVISYAILGFFVFGILSLKLAKSNTKAIFFNLAFVCLVLISAERYLYSRGMNNAINFRKVNNTPGTIVSGQKIVGYAPVKNSVDTVRFFVDDSLIWQQVYTIDKNGQRVMPGYTPKKDANQSILFFGCSVTFGEGLPDKGSFPYKVGEIFSNKYKVYNFAYGGYGTHQALSLLEHNVVDSIVEYEPKYCIYLAIPDHVNRIINIRDWGGDGPKFLPDEKGEPVFRGYFGELPLTRQEWLRNKLLQSEMYKSIFGREGHGNDADLFIAMVDKMQRIIHKKYPRCEFHLLYWEDAKWKGLGMNLCGKIQKRLSKKKRWNIHYVSQIIPDYLNHNHQIYYPYDLHPKEYINDTIAHYIARNIVKPTQL
jgi:hypothetical protein